MILFIVVHLQSNSQRSVETYIWIKTEQYLWMTLECKMLNIYSRFDRLQECMPYQCFMKAGWLLCTEYDVNYTWSCDAFNKDH